MIIQTQGIVIKASDFRETSRIVTFYTATQGKIKGVMKGVRKDPRKFGSSIDRYSVNDIVYYQYSRSDLHLISQCDLARFYFQIRQDYRCSLAANYMLELIDTVMPAEHPNTHIYRLMLDYLEALETVKDVDKLVHIFQVKVLSLSGFRPHIDACVQCQKAVTGKARFSLQSGGLMCGQCFSADRDYTVISGGTVATILHIERNDWGKSLRLGLTETVRRELKYLLNNFLVYHLGKNIRTAKYL